MAYTQDQLQEMARAAASAYPKDPNGVSKILQKMQNDPNFMAEMDRRYAYKFGGDPEQTTGSPRDTMLDNMLYMAMTDGQSPPASMPQQPSSRDQPTSKSPVATKADASGSPQSQSVPLPKPDPRQSMPQSPRLGADNTQPKGSVAGSDFGSAAMALPIIAGTGYALAYGVEAAGNYYRDRIAAGVSPDQVIYEMSVGQSPAVKSNLPAVRDNTLPAQMLSPQSMRQTDVINMPPNHPAGLLPAPAPALPMPPESSPLYDLPSGQRPTTSALDDIVTRSMTASETAAGDAAAAAKKAAKRAVRK